MLIWPVLILDVSCSMASLYLAPSVLKSGGFMRLCWSESRRLDCRKQQLLDEIMLKSRRNALLSLRLRFHDDARVGPGKIALLEAVAQHAEVASAAASMDMSPRRAWLLIDSLNNAFEKAVVELSDPDRPAGSEAQLTELGKELVSAYRQVEQDSAQAVRERFAGVVAQLRIEPDAQ